MWFGSKLAWPGPRDGVGASRRIVVGVPIDRINVRHGDTGLIQFGGGSYASRTAVMSGHAVQSAAVAVKEKAIRAAAHKLEVGEQDLRLVNGRVELSARRMSTWRLARSPAC